MSRLIAILTLVLAPLPALGAYSDLVLAEDPIGYWRLGEASGPTALDAAGANDGSYGALTILGASGAVDDGDTAVGILGGASSKVTIPTAAALTPSTFTIELWARPTAAPGAGRSPATYRDLVTASNISGWQLLHNAAGNWELSIGRGNVGSGSAWNTIEGPAATLNEWAHLVGSYDGSDMRFYVDGEEVGALDAVSYVPVDAFFFFINFFIGAGRSEDVSATGDLFWIGEVDEVALYGHALDPAAVQAHYAAATQGSGPQLAPIVGADKLAGEARFTFPTELGRDYRLRRSADRTTWLDIGPVVVGTGELESQGDPVAAGSTLELYRVEVAP